MVPGRPWSLVVHQHGTRLACYAGVVKNHPRALCMEVAVNLALDADADGAAPAGYLTTNATTFETVGVAPVATNAWTHLAVTYDGANLARYVNGAVAEVTPASGMIITTTGALRLGGNSLWGEYFAGRIDFSADLQPRAQPK